MMTSRSTMLVHLNFIRNITITFHTVNSPRFIIGVHSTLCFCSGPKLQKCIGCWWTTKDWVSFIHKFPRIARYLRRFICFLNINMMLVVGITSVNMIWVSVGWIISNIRLNPYTKTKKQEIIPVGCIPSAFQPYPTEGWEPTPREGVSTQPQGVSILSTPCEQTDASELPSRNFVAGGSKMVKLKLKPKVIFYGYSWEFNGKKSVLRHQKCQVSGEGRNFGPYWTWYTRQ